MPFEINIELDQPQQLKQVDLYLKPKNEASRWLGVITNPSSNINFTWPPNPPGTYTLSLVLTDFNNYSSPGPKVTVEINN
ncbi:MAG: hypothetical protein UV47_C0037G0007 [Parcubacteria group bacterium GW2011_GWA2_42_80]|nr:MAG: hypothetical protein UV47_C0037G0007 [Parcubacteria group bacterium GW2011_GWA2_42_80]